MGLGEFRLSGLRLLRSTKLKVWVWASELGGLNACLEGIAFSKQRGIEPPKGRSMKTTVLSIGLRGDPCKCCGRASIGLEGLKGKV